MADLVNLRLHRKRKRRADREEQAAQNRVIHGRTRAERVTVAAQNMLERRRLDAGHIERRDADDEQD